MERYRLGVRIENPNVDLVAFERFIRGTQIYALFSGLNIEGPRMPSEGPVLVTANHTSYRDIITMGYAGILSGRMIRGVARRDLIDTTYNEPKEVLERTGKEGHFDPMKLPLVRPFIASVLGGIGAIPITRERPRNPVEDKQVEDQFNETLVTGQVLGMFFQESRVKNGDLSNIMPGIGAFILRNPEIPVVVATIWPKRFGYKIILHEAVTGNQLIGGERLRSREVTARVVDICASGMPELIRNGWEEIYRPPLINPPKTPKN